MTFVWLNGRILPAEEARVDPTDRGFTLGDGVFETMRCEAGIALHVDRHLARLRDGAGVLGIAVPWSDDALRSAMENLLAAEDFSDAALRLTLTRGPALRGVLPPGTGLPTVLISAGPLPPPLPPARLIIASSTRRNEFSPLSRIKSLNYLDNIIARREADAARADDALLLNTAGRVAEATAANIFVRHHGRLITPPVADGALPGIRRALILESKDAVAEHLTLEILARADAAFLVNSLGTRQVASINGRQITIPAQAS